MNQWKLTDLTVKKVIFTDESKGQITDSISENLTDSDLEGMHKTTLRRSVFVHFWGRYCRKSQDFKLFFNNE